MREIKFRAWDTSGKTWEQDTLLIRINGDNPKHLILQQFTGLLDKNGKEIYEGDILQLDSWTDIQQVKFIEGAFCLAFLGGKYDGEYSGDIHYTQHANIQQATIVGNIYEFPTSPLSEREGK